MRAYTSTRGIAPAVLESRPDARPDRGRALLLSHGRSAAGGQARRTSATLALGGPSYRQVLELARRYRGEDTEGYRVELVKLVELAKELKR